MQTQNEGLNFYVMK